MRAVLTRVKSASVTIDGEVVGKIGQGFLILLGVAVVIVMILLTLREHHNQRIHIPFWLWVAGGILLAALFLLLCINCIPSIGVSAVEHPAIPIAE